MRPRSRDAKGRFAQEVLTPSTGIAEQGRIAESPWKEDLGSKLGGDFRAHVVPQPSTPITRPTYLTDADCGFCRDSMSKVQALFPGTFDAIPYWEGPLEELGLDLDKCYEVGHFLMPTPDGRVRVMPGSLSWAGVLQLQGPGWRFLGKTMEHQPVKAVADVVYGWVARNRSRLGRQACEVPKSTLRSTDFVT